MAALHKSSPIDVVSESADGDGLLQRKADRIIRILSQVAECLDEFEMEDMNAIVLEVLEVSKQKDTEDKREILIKLYMGFLRVVEFCSGISVKLINQAIISFQMIEQDAVGLGSLVYDMYMEMILVEYPSLGIDMNLTPDLLRAYFRLLTEGYEEMCHIRLMVVGMYQVGKTTLIRRLCNQDTVDVQSTVGVDIFTNSCEINDDGDWEISTQDEKERFYNERLQELVIKYGKRTQIPNIDSSFSEPEPEQETPTNAMISTTSSPSTTTLTDYETEKESFKKRVDENRQQDNKSFFEDFQKATKQKKIHKRKPTVSIWDFAGQSVYYSTHHLFLNARSTYLVVLDMSKKLTDKLDEKSPLLESTTEGYTCHDAFKFWMKSIYIYTEQKQRKTALFDKNRIQIPTYKPTIILIGTHKDDLTADMLKGQTLKQYKQNYFNEALKCFLGTPIMDLVHDKKFLISKDDDKEEFLSIKREILKIAENSQVWREKVPAQFILLEKAVQDKKRQGDSLMYLEDLEEVNKSSDLPKQNRDDIKAFLVFQNAFGNVIYYGQDYLDRMIILNPQWIIDILKIFVSHEAERKVADLEHWKIFDTFGQLEEGFIFKLLEGNNFPNIGQAIVKCMEYLDIMVRPIASEKNEASQTGSMSRIRQTTPFFQEYYVDTQKVKKIFIMPCKLPLRPTDEELKKLFADCGSRRQPPTLCMYIRKGFLPPFVFHCIIATIIKELPIATVKGQILMFSGLAGFQLNSTRILLIWCIDNFLHVTVIFKDDDETDGERVKCCKVVKSSFEKLVLSAFNFHGKTNFDNALFEYSVRCPKCPQPVQVPFQKPMESKPDMKGLLSVKNIEFTKKMNCNICDKVVNEKEALVHWFDINSNKIEPASSAQEEHLKGTPTVDMLADFADEIGCNPKRLACELSIEDKEYDKIAQDFDFPHSNLVFHILYKWKSKNESLKMLHDAMKSAECCTDNFDRIVRRIETDKTEKKINGFMERLKSLDITKPENHQKWNVAVNRLIHFIGAEHWLLGIRLGMKEEEMQLMRTENLASKECIRKYFQEWWNRDEGLKDLIKALVKSSPKVDDITDAFVQVYSS